MEYQKPQLLISVILISYHVRNNVSKGGSMISKKLCGALLLFNIAVQAGYKDAIWGKARHIKAQVIDASTTPSVVASMAAAAVGVGTATYLYNRESNQSKIDKAHKAIELYEKSSCPQLLACKTLTDMQQFLQKYPNFKQKATAVINAVELAFKDMTARYGSYVKPWNWTEPMKKAYHDVRSIPFNLVREFKHYSAVIAYGKKPMNDATLLKLIVSMGLSSSAYLMMMGFKEIQSSIKVLRLYINDQGLYFDSALVLAELLEYMAQEIIVSDRYMKESIAYEEKQLQEQRLALERSKVLHDQWIGQNVNVRIRR